MPMPAELLERMTTILGYPPPTDEESQRFVRKCELEAQARKGRPWDIRDREEAVACGAASRAEIDQYVSCVNAARALGFEPHLAGGINIPYLDASRLARTAAGDYVLPAPINSLSYRGLRLRIYDPTRDQYVLSIGRHRATGQLVGFTRHLGRPPQVASSAAAGAGWLRRLFTASPDSAEYDCIWIWIY